jgi:hypothetical protein
LRPDDEQQRPETNADHDPAGAGPADRRAGARADALGNGRYELSEFVGKGGMGAVYRARDVELDRWVAVKCLLDVTNARARELAVKEARTLASLSHPNIMRVFDILSVGDQVWIVTEWLEGKTLAKHPLPLSTPAVLAVMAQVYDALAAAHAANVVHRDVKPGNVIVGKDGRARLIDFGVAYAPGSSTGDTLVGSLRYTDPRIMEGEAPDASTDMFSAALLQVELMMGETVLPDLAPLPLYRHAKRNLDARLDELLDGCYPPLAELARRLVGKRKTPLVELVSGFDTNDRADADSAREAARLCAEALRVLSDKTPERYLADGADGLCRTETPAAVKADLEAEHMLLEEATAMVADPALAPREKAAWIAFKAAMETPKWAENEVPVVPHGAGEQGYAAPLIPPELPHHLHPILPPWYAWIVTVAKQVSLRVAAARDASRLFTFVSLATVVLAMVVLWMKVSEGPTPPPLPEGQVAESAGTATGLASAGLGVGMGTGVGLGSDLVLGPTAPASVGPVLDAEQERGLGLAPTASGTLSAITPRGGTTGVETGVTTGIAAGSILTASATGGTGPTSLPGGLVPVQVVANAWAAVAVDGKEIGRLPQAAPFGLTPGRHRMTLTNPTVEPLTTEVLVEAGKPMRLHFTLAPKVTAQRIRLKKPGRLFVDGKDLGVIDGATLVPMTYGAHRIWVKRGARITRPLNVALGPEGPREIVVE